PTVAFERYVDDAVVHCVSEVQAHQLVAAIAERMEQIGLRLHPDKTKIVYCQDGTRRSSYEHTAFTFLGFTFRQPRARNKHGRNFNNFLPAISKEALKESARRYGHGDCTAVPATPSTTSHGASIR